MPGDCSRIAVATISGAGRLPTKTRIKCQLDRKGPKNCRALCGLKRLLLHSLWKALPLPRRRAADTELRRVAPLFTPYKKIPSPQRLMPTQRPFEGRRVSRFRQVFRRPLGSYTKRGTLVSWRFRSGANCPLSMNSQTRLSPLCRHRDCAPVTLGTKTKRMRARRSTRCNEMRSACASFIP